MKAHGFPFDFVISYASQDEGFAGQMAQLLKKSGAEVFFAPDFQAEIWGKNLYEYLAEIYSKKGRFCLLLVSQPYVEKQWTRHEWKNAQERALASIDSEYILPLRLDDALLPGLPSTIAYLDARSTSIEVIAKIAIDKLSSAVSDTLPIWRQKKIEELRQLLEEFIGTAPYRHTTVRIPQVNRQLTSSLFSKITIGRCELTFAFFNGIGFKQTNIMARVPNPDLPLEKYEALARQGWLADSPVTRTKKWEPVVNARFVAEDIVWINEFLGIRPDNLVIQVKQNHGVGDLDSEKNGH